MGGEEEENAEEAAAPTRSGRYVAPNAGTVTREEDYGIRITNVPEYYTVEELEQLIKNIFTGYLGPNGHVNVKRVHVPVDKNKVQRGLAFINLDSLADATRALERLNGFRLDYNILKAELT